MLTLSQALQVGEVVPFLDHAKGVEKAREILQSSAALDKVEELVKFLES